MIPLVVFVSLFIMNPFLGTSVQALKYSQFKWSDIQQVQITAYTLNVRTGPGIEYPSIGHIKRGQIVDVLGSLQDWYVVHLPDDSVGVISSKYTRVYRYRASAQTGAFSETDSIALAVEPSVSLQPGTEALKMLELINEERAQQGLLPYVLDPEISKIAVLKASDMATNQYFGHDSPIYGSPFAMLKQFGIPYRSAGENIAGNQSIENAHTSIMNSPSHRSHILSNQFQKIGIGVVEDKRYGKIIVQLFTAN